MARKLSNNIVTKRAKRVLNAIQDQDKVFVLVLNNSRFKSLVIDLNTEKQLYDRGIDSSGRSLASIGGGYSPVTIDIKRSKGQPTDRVTLKDTGDFYKTFNVIVERGKVTITADAIKEDTDLIKEWGDDIIGLTDESMGIIINFAKDEYIKYLRKLWAG